MSAERFLDQLEAQGLLDDKIIHELRGQVARKSKKVTPEAIAKMLVDNGHLTRFQASKLMSAAKSGNGGVSATAPAENEADDELGFAPDEEEGPSPVPGRKTSAATKTAEPELATVEDEAEEEHDDEIVELETAHDDEHVAGPVSPPEPAGAGTGGLEPLADSGLEPLDDLGGHLDMGGGHPGAAAAHAAHAAHGLDGTGLADPLAAEHAHAPAAPPHPAKPARPKTQRNQWDSKLLLIGGAALMLLIAALVVLWYAVFRGSAQEVYDLAAEDYRAGAYTQAIKKFERFERDYAGNPLISAARIKIGMCRLWQAFEGSSDPERALRTAQEVLPQISNEDPQVFEAEARDELAGLLPGIAERFSEQAVRAGDTETAQNLVQLTNEALELVNNPLYIPGSRRKALQARIQGILENVARVQQSIRQDKRRVEAVADMAKHVEAGETAEAYQVYKTATREFHALKDHPEMRQAVLSITERVRELVQVEQQTMAALSEDVERPPTRSVILANRLGKSAGGISGEVAYVLAGGAVYGLDASSGGILWRRFVGYETTWHPQPINNQPGADCLLVDYRRHELVRLDARSGDLVWRLPVGSPFTDPLITEERIVVVERGGRLLEINPETGESTRQVILPQTVSVGPASYTGRPQLYQPGEHSNLYVLSTDTLQAREVLYLGHEAGSITVPPVMALGYLLVVENVGADDARLHILSTNASGLEVKPAQDPILLQGNVLVSPRVFGRRVLLVTDRGEIQVMSVDPNAEVPVGTVAINRADGNADPMIRYSAVSDSDLWIGDERLTKYEIQTSRGKLALQWIKDNGDVFLAPLQTFGDVVLETLQRDGSTGITVATRDMRSGDLVWQTELGVAAAEIIVDPQTLKTRAISASGSMFEINGESVQRGYNDEPTENVGSAIGNVSYTQAVDLGDGRHAFASPREPRRAVVYNPNDPSNRLRVVTLKVPSAETLTTCPPLAFDGALLMALNNGQVVNLDMVTGGDHLLPFQPDVQAGTRVQWRSPALLEGGREFVITDDRKNLFRVGIESQPEPHLKALASQQLEFEISSPLAASGSLVFGVTRRERGDTVVVFQASNLEIAQEQALQGRVTWGPHAVGDLVFLTTDAEGLLCFEPGAKLRWKSPLPHGALAGPPVSREGRLLLASKSGFVWTVDAQTGELVGEPLEVGEPLGDAPVIFPSGLLLSGSDGAVHLVTMPEG